MSSKFTAAQPICRRQSWEDLVEAASQKAYPTPSKSPCLNPKPRFYGSPFKGSRVAVPHLEVAFATDEEPECDSRGARQIGNMHLKYLVEGH